MELEIGKKALATGTNIVNKMDKVSFKRLRKYFSVDDTFVMKKILLLLFPYNNSDWSENIDSDTNLGKPELYIPTMSYISYIVLRSIYMGIKHKFTPENIGLILTRTALLEFVFILLTKLSGYFMDVPFNFFSLLSYFGYKYFILLLLRIFPIPFLNPILGIYLYVTYFVFLSRSLKGAVLRGGSDRSKKVYFLFTCVAIQTIIAFILSYY